MRFIVITLFPEMIENAISFGVVGQAIKAGRLSVSSLSPRLFTSNVHQTIDDRPFGGGDGMVMMAEPAAQALDSVLKFEAAPSQRRRVVHLSPRGRPFSDALARELAAGSDELVLISSRYGGIDERFLIEYGVEEISIGDYVLSGGELAALVVIDGVSRHVAGVLGNEVSNREESFGGDFSLLEHPQFTRPREWRGLEVPKGFLSGDHAKIKAFKAALSLLVTLERRPDLLTEKIEEIPVKRYREALAVLGALSEQERKECGLKDIKLIEERLISLLEG